MSKKPKRIRNRKIPAEIQALKPDHKIFALVRRSVNPKWSDCFPGPEPGVLPKFRPNTVRKLCETMLDTKLPMEFAAMAMGFTVREFDEWMKRGEEDMENNVSSPESYLAYHVNRTRAKVVTMILREMDESGAGTWQKYAWELERSFTMFKNHAPAGRVKTPDKTILDELQTLWVQGLNSSDNPLDLPKLDPGTKPGPEPSEESREDAGVV